VKSERYAKRIIQHNYINLKYLLLLFIYLLIKLIRKTLKSSWEDVDLYKNVLLILSVPAEYSEKEKAIMRECAYLAKLIEDQDTEFLQFTTERMLFYFVIYYFNISSYINVCFYLAEAAAVYCMENCLKEYETTGIGSRLLK
jgi:hypothetical protein